LSIVPDTRTDVAAGFVPFNPCVVIPVYNHEHAIGIVVERIRTQNVAIVLVDDGSDAQCAAELDRLSTLDNVSLLRHEQNRGKGAAVCWGLRHAFEQGFTHAIQVDADGQHTLSDVSRFIEEARVRPKHVICGHPIFDASIPKSRYYGRYLTHALVWVETLSFDIIDSMCGFRLYPLAATVALLDEHGVGARMDFDTEILVRLYWRGMRLHWIATPVSYPLDGVSHFRMFLDNVRMTSLHVRLILGMLIRLPLLVPNKIARIVMREPNKGDVHV
jgi:glycosyltransferase involved in cell wall biosynthesis